MARGSRVAGIIKSGLLAAALMGGLAAPGYAGDPPKLALTGSAWLTTDYMFRSISNTNQNPAAQVEFDATYGIFYGYVWGSNTAFGENIELDYGLGITPKWGPITFNFAGLAYTYPGASDIDYFEALGGASWTGGAWTLGVKDYWSPDNFQFFGESECDRGIGRLCLHRQALEFLYAQHKRHRRLPVVRQECRRLRVLECRPDPWFPGALVC